MEKFVLKKQRYLSSDNYYRCRISSEAKEIIDDIGKKTNLSDKEIVSKMIIFANAHLEIIEE